MNSDRPANGAGPRGTLPLGPGPFTSPTKPREVTITVSFDELFALAKLHLPERLRMLKVAPHDVDDLVHDVVLVAHRQGPLRMARGEKREREEVVKAWLSGIAWRQVVKRRRRAHRRLELPTGDGANLPVPPADEGPSSEQLVAVAEGRDLLLRMLGHLRIERAEVLVLHDVFELRAKDIAEELRLNENTVTSRLIRARRDVRAAFRRLSPEEQGAVRMVAGGGAL